jgi:uncharacterized protein
MSWINPSSEGVIVNIRVTPRASRNAIQGLFQDALKIRLQAPPVEGKANEALVRFLADALDVPQRAVAILSGDTGRNKRVLIRGVTVAQVQSLAGAE